MPHGDFSDVAALTTAGTAIMMMFYPATMLTPLPVPGIMPFFDASELSAELETMVRFAGGFLIVLACMLFTVRWNTINGKMSGLALIGCAANIAYTTYHCLDKGAFVPRPFYGLSALLSLTGMKLMFFANPMPGAAPKKSN